MPYTWDAPQRDGTRRLALYPHRALTPRGFAAFIAATAVLFTFPLTALLGGPALWFVLLPALVVLWGVWTAIRHNSREAGRGEVMTLSRERITLTHTLTDPPLTWVANPYWVRVQIHPTGGPVEHYLTLKGDGREVEIGAFLSPDERRRLAAELRDALASLVRPARS